MNYEQQEQVKKLSHFIKTNTIDDFIIRHDKEALETELIWNSSRFWAKVLHKAAPLQYECTLVEFLTFKTNYETQNTIVINSDRLFNEFWLRNVLGFIETPGTISTACYSFTKIKDRKDELTFLCHFYPAISGEKNNVDKSVFENAIKAYNQANNTIIDSKKICEPGPGWLSEKDGKIQFSNMDIYFKPFLEYWDDFNFISALSKQYKNKIEGLSITKEAFENLHDSFSNLYSDIPSIEILKQQKIVHADSEDKYSINFYNSEPRYWSELNNKITGYYWELLIKDTNYSTDTERIKLFLSQISYWESSSDVLSNVTANSKRRFLDAAFELVITEPDIIGGTDEFQKVSIDAKSTHNFYFLNSERTKHGDFSLNNSDPFELFESFNKWERKARITYLHDQRSRKKLGFLIQIIIKHDSEFERYKRITALLKDHTTKPILLWYTTRCIIMYRKEIIPFLLLDKNFISLSFQIIDEFKFSEEQRSIISQKLWVKCIELALITIRSEINEKEVSAKIVFQIYRQLNANKYDVPYNRQSKSVETLMQQEKENKEKMVLSLFEDSPLHNHKVHGDNSEYFIPVIFNDLFKQFSNFDITPLYNNGTIQFPMLQWDGLSWLMKCSTYWKYKTQFNALSPDIHKLTNTFFTLYMSRIEVTEVNKYNFFDNKEEKGLPLWSEKIERLQYIEWIYPIYFIFKQLKFNSFLEPRFIFDTTEDQYHAKNQFIADKLRTHIGVLLQVLRKLISPSIPYGFDKKELSNIKLRIEQQIIDYLKNHTKDVPQQGRIDLFDYKKEVGFNASENEALLPQIARSINWFSNKEAIVDAIIRTNDVVKILTVAELVTSEGIKEILIKKIEKSNLQSFLEKSHWIPEIQTALLKITRYPQLMNQINEIVAYWEENISDKDKQYKNQLYQTKLLIAYFHKDEQELNSVEEPDKDTAYGRRQLSHYDHKEFYRALIKIKDDPDSSYAIFNKLVKQYPKYPVLAMNRMAAKINMVNSTNDTILYSEVLEEWNVYEKENSELDVTALGENFYLNKFFVLLKLGKYEQLDEEFGKLELPYQMLPGILETKLGRLLAEKKTLEAIMLLESAERYHQYSSTVEVEFINDLKKQIQGIDNVEELKVHYNRIFNSTPTKLIRIFPEMLNGRVSIEEFITNEVALATNRMLDKVNSLAKIANENKYNDIVHLALESRIGSWGWSVKDQTRKAFSPTEKDLGEIDLDIQDWNKKSFLTCEAFILRDATRVQSHIEKVIAHYTHDRKAFIILVYYLDPKAKFEEKWKEYSETIIPNLAFPTGYSIASKQVIDFTKDFGFNKSAIKIGKSTHGGDTPLYHIFVNIDYKI